MVKSCSTTQLFFLSLLCLLGCHILPANALSHDIIDDTDINWEWQGPWHFEREWFNKQHPWLPRFVKNIALKATLILDEKTQMYHQVDDKGQPLKEPRGFRVVKSLKNAIHFLRKEERGKEIAFRVEKRDDGHLYYCESDAGGKNDSMIYRIHRPPGHDNKVEF